MGFLLLACQTVLGVVLIWAATGKLLSHDGFLVALRVSGLPKRAIAPIAWLTPRVELGLAVALVLSPPAWLAVALLATCGLLGVFTGWMIRTYCGGFRVSCACFGTGSGEIGPHTVARNGILLGVSFVGVVLALHGRSPLPPPSVWLLMSTLSTALLLMLLKAAWYAGHALGLPAWLRPVQ